MSAAEFIFKHFCRVRHSGLPPTSWALLLWLSMQGECWRTRVQIMQALSWRKDQGTTGMMSLVSPLLDRGYIERSSTGGRGPGRWAYRITQQGEAFLKLNVGGEA